MIRDTYITAYWLMRHMRPNFQTELLGDVSASRLSGPMTTPLMDSIKDNFEIVAHKESVDVFSLVSTQLYGARSRQKITPFGKQA